MSDRNMWKMLHLLHLYGRPELTLTELKEAGVECIPDTIWKLVQSGSVIESPPATFTLSPSVLKIFDVATLANKQLGSDNLRVDYPRVFVIMPFRESWSDAVFDSMIEPAVKNAEMECTRGDTIIRIGDLTSNLWNEIMRAGVIIADVSVPNSNVFYELGLVHAIGKDAILLKQARASLPADFGGAHYYEYDPADLRGGEKLLRKVLISWGEENHSAGVKAMATG